MGGTALRTQVASDRTRELLGSGKGPGKDVDARGALTPCLPVDLFQPFRDVEGTPPKRFPLVLHRLRRKLDVMEQLGPSTLSVCSNATPQAVDDRELAAEQPSAAGDLATSAGDARATWSAGPWHWSGRAYRP